MNKKLICFTYAGGTAAFYDKIESVLSPEVEVIKLEYAGHGTRHNEKMYDNFSELAKDMYKQIQMLQMKREQYSLMGYSMGSISVVEVLKEIMNHKNLHLPQHIFLAAHAPFPKSELIGYESSEIDSYIKKRTIKFGGIPKELINNDSFWRVYLPLYKADYSLIMKYDFNLLNIKTTIPATIFYSETDTPFHTIKKWKTCFIGKCDFIAYNGNHFFIDEHYREISDVIKERLNE